MNFTDEYCICGLAEEDPMHKGWHQIYEWNLGVFERETINRHKTFEKVYGHEIKKKYHNPDTIPF